MNKKTSKMYYHNKAEKFWDRTAKNYDKEEKEDEKTYIDIIAKTSLLLKTDDIVLDYGCGTGLISNEIAGNVKKVYAMDISSKMIEIAKEKAIRSKIQNVYYAHSTIFNEKYKSGTFDVIFAFYVLHLTEDPQKIIRRMYELLKPEGLIISVTPCMGEKPVLNILFSLASKIGIMPGIKPFKFPELEILLNNGNFEIIEKDSLHKKSAQYFISAKKSLAV